MSPSGTAATPGRGEQPRAVMAQLADRFVNVRRGEVRALLHETLRDRRRPAPRQLLERADIEIAIVKEALELRHIAGEKAPVLADTAAAHGRAARGYQRHQEFKRALLRIGDADAARAHP